MAWDCTPVREIVLTTKGETQKNVYQHASKWICNTVSQRMQFHRQLLVLCLHLHVSFGLTQWPHSEQNWSFHINAETLHWTLFGVLVAGDQVCGVLLPLNKSAGHRMFKLLLCIHRWILPRSLYAWRCLIKGLTCKIGEQNLKCCLPVPRAVISIWHNTKTHASVAFTDWTNRVWNWCDSAACRCRVSH